MCIAKTSVNLMAKPAGPLCNLNCTYCFYLEKQALFPKDNQKYMTDQVLEAYIRQTVNASCDTNLEVLFVWQGGEPTLAGLDFFKRALELEKKYTSGRPFSNNLQTNGTLLNDEWCNFLAENNFFVGLSLDGPEFVHDYYRRDAAGSPTFNRVFESLNLLQKYGIKYNVLACVSKEGSKYPLEIYNFFKEAGVEFIQFSPIVERTANSQSKHLGLKLGMPVDYGDQKSPTITSWSVEPEAFGDFYIKIFDEWVRNDVGKIFIMNFEWTLNNYLGGKSPVCYLNSRCGNACIVEHNGDVYSCDHFVYPEFKLGNILDDDIMALVNSEKQIKWGERKSEMLSTECLHCDAAFICRGGCPKHRFIGTTDTNPGENYLCQGYKNFYNHTAKYLKAFQKLLELNLPLDYIKGAIGKPLLLKTVDKQQVVLWIK